MVKLEEEIHELIVKARQSNKSEDAMRFAQAACNAANALATIDHIRRADN